MFGESKLYWLVNSMSSIKFFWYTTYYIDVFHRCTYVVRAGWNLFQSVSLPLVGKETNQIRLVWNGFKWLMHQSNVHTVSGDNSIWWTKTLPVVWGTPTLFACLPHTPPLKQCWHSTCLKPLLSTYVRPANYVRLHYVSGVHRMHVILNRSAALGQ